MVSRLPLLETATARDRIARLRAHHAVPAILHAAAGARALLVGGATRDAALGRPVCDLDVLVDRDGAGVAARLASALGGRAVALAPGRFAAVRIAAPELEVDIWDLEGGSLERDLARRDLTINAIALDLANGEILDRHEGLEDLARRVLRAVAPDTFENDPLRVLRLARFALGLGGFTIAPQTLDLARRAAPGLVRIAGERIRDELDLLAASARADREQALLEAVGAFPLLWNGFHTASAPSAVQLLGRYVRLRARLDPDRRLPGEAAARHALRLLAAPSPEPLRERSAGLGRRAILTRVETRAVARLLDLPRAAPPGGDERRLWLYRLGALWSAGLAVAAAAAPAAHRPSWRDYLDEAAAAVERRGDDLLAPRPLLDGHEVAALLGLEAGPELGAALDGLVLEQVAERVRSVADARRYLLARRRHAADLGG